MGARPISVGGPWDPTPAILVVDDEAGVIEAVRETLWSRGYRLIATTDPLRALDILRSKAPVDLLITDLFMPGLSGSRLLKEGRRLRPGLRALLLTGLASPEESARWHRRGETLVFKPWTDEEFHASIGEALRTSRTKEVSRPG